MRAFALLCLVGCAAPTAPSPSSTRPAAPEERYAIVVSIDGMMPGTYAEPDAHGLKVPTLRALVAEGLASPGAQPVFPTVTYPNHTAMATGVQPARHGIFGNMTFDPEEKNRDGWYWYAEDIKAHTIWDAAAARGLRTALISWPVTVGAHATALLPEVWRAGTADDLKLVHALATPGLIESVTARFPDFPGGYHPPSISDRASTDAAVEILGRVRPNLLMLHIFQTDDAEHEHGPWSPEALAALENADTQLGRVVAAAKEAGMWDRTLLLVVSDHGFQAYNRAFKPAAALRKAGLIELDDSGHVRIWKAAVAANGGSATIYARSSADGEAAKKTLANDPAVRRVLDPREIGGDPAAAFAIEAADGWSFMNGSVGEPVVNAVSRGTHGYGNDRESMRASLLVRVPGAARGNLAGARLIDVAPTVAAWLGADLPGVEGRSLLPR